MVAFSNLVQSLTSGNSTTTPKTYSIEKVSVTKAEYDGWTKYMSSIAGTNGARYFAHPDYGVIKSHFQATHNFGQFISAVQKIASTLNKLEAGANVQNAPSIIKADIQPAIGSSWTPASKTPVKKILLKSGRIVGISQDENTYILSLAGKLKKSIASMHSEAFLTSGNYGVYRNSMESAARAAMSQPVVEAPKPADLVTSLLTQVATTAAAPQLETGLPPAVVEPAAPAPSGDFTRILGVALFATIVLIVLSRRG